MKKLLDDGICVGKVFNVPVIFLPSSLFLISIMTHGFFTHISKTYNFTSAELCTTTFLLVFLTILSLLAHEFSHVKVGYFFGYETVNVEVMFIGMAANMVSVGKKPGEHFAIAVAGPFMSFLLGVIFYNLTEVVWFELPESIGALSKMLGTINFVLAIFNLLPIYPLDGGRILLSLIWFFRKNYINSVKIMSTLSVLLMVPLTYISISAGLVMVSVAFGFVFLYNLPILLLSYKELEEKGYNVS